MAAPLRRSRGRSVRPLAAPVRPFAAPGARRRIVTVGVAAAVAIGAAAGCGANSSGSSTSAQGVAGGAPALPEAPRPGNHFEDVGENAWVDPATDAQSTFGLDVDTASYTVGRRWIDEGSRPEPDSVRVEEYLNAVVETPPIEGDTALRAEVAGATSPFGTAQERVQLLRVGVQGAPVADDERPDVDLTFVIDVSGSMAMENRIGLVKQSLVLLTEELRPSDTIAIVVYGTQARVVLDPTPVAERDEIVDVIDGLETEGSTNAEQGLAIGYEIARSTLAPDRINRVVLASDGVANVGVSDPKGLTKQLRDDADAGVHLITLGYGMGNFNDALMEQLADRGDGFYAYIDTYDEAVRLFADELTSSLVTVADDSKSQVTFDPAAVAGYRLVGYENRAIADEDFTDDTVDAGDVGAGHSVTALYEVRLREGIAPSTPIATVDLRWSDPGSGQASSLSVPVTAETVSGSFAEADDTTRLAGLVAGWAEIVGGREALVDRGIGFEALLTEIDAAEGDLGQNERFVEFAELARRSAAL